MKKITFVFFVFFCFWGDSMANVSFKKTIFSSFLSEEALIKYEAICFALEEINDGFDMDEYVQIVSEGSYRDFETLSQKYFGIIKRSRESGDFLGELFYQIYFLNLKIVQIEKFSQKYADQEFRVQEKLLLEKILEVCNEKIEKYYSLCYGE